MAAQDELFQLIKSLTPSEKRYFKVNGDSKSNYMQLFDAIDKQKEEYDEDLLKRKNTKKAFTKYLSAEKKQLREQIMKHMRSFHSTRAVDNQINELLQDETFMRDKGLNDQREKVILKAKELATKYERFHLLNEILGRQIAYVIEFEQKKLTEPVINLINEQKQLAVIVETELELQTKNRELFSIYRSGADILDPSVSNRVQMLVAEIERFWSRVGDWFSLGVIYHRGLSNYHQIRKDWLASFEHTTKEYKLYQDHSHFKEEDSYYYKICLANLMSRSLSSGEYKWFTAALEEMKTVPIHSFNEEGEVFQNVYFQEHLYYINAGEFGKAEELIPEIEAGIIKYASKINKARKLAFQFNIMIMYFLLHNFKKALEWTDLLMDDNSQIKENQKFITVLLLPFIHFELGHTDLVESYSRAAYRRLKGKNRLHQFERIVLSYLKQMPLSTNDTNFSNTVGQFHNSLQKLADNPSSAKTIGMEELSLWAKSHVEGIPMYKQLSSIAH